MALDTARYERSIASAVERAAAEGVRVLAVSDSHVSPIARSGDVVVPGRRHRRGPVRQLRRRARAHQPARDARDPPARPARGPPHRSPRRRLGRDRRPPPRLTRPAPPNWCAEERIFTSFCASVRRCRYVCTETGPSPGTIVPCPSRPSTRRSRPCPTSSAPRPRSEPVSPSGAVLVRGLDVGTPGPTPAAMHPAQLGSRSAGSLLAAAGRLGHPVGYVQEHGGQVVQNIYPLAESVGQQISTSSDVPLAFHTETAFHPHKSHFLLLLCLRGDPGAATELCSVDARRPTSERRGGPHARAAAVPNRRRPVIRSRRRLDDRARSGARTHRRRHPHADLRRRAHHRDRRGLRRGARRPRRRDRVDLHVDRPRRRRPADRRQSPCRPRSFASSRRVSTAPTGGCSARSSWTTSPRSPTGGDR